MDIVAHSYSYLSHDGCVGFSKYSIFYRACSDDGIYIYLYALNFFWIFSSSLSSATTEKVANAVHVERKREAEGLVERIALGGGDDIACIEGEYVHLEACAHSEVGAIALVGVLVVITATEEELVVVGILKTNAPLDFLHFLLETIRGIVEGLEDT